MKKYYIYPISKNKTNDGIQVIAAVVFSDQITIGNIKAITGTFLLHKETDFPEYHTVFSKSKITSHGIYYTKKGEPFIRIHNNRILLNSFYSFDKFSLEQHYSAILKQDLNYYFVLCNENFAPTMYRTNATENEVSEAISEEKALNCYNNQTIINCLIKRGFKIVEITEDFHLFQY